jgi:hypothetical protein
MSPLGDPAWWADPAWWGDPAWWAERFGEVTAERILTLVGSALVLQETEGDHFGVRSCYGHSVITSHRFALSDTIGPL